MPSGVAPSGARARTTATLGVFYSLGLGPVNDADAVGCQYFSSRVVLHRGLRSPGSVPTLARAVVARRHCPLRGLCLAEPQRPAQGGGRPRLGPPRAARP